jgi:BMFP domain-containing protein YqiC
MEYVLVLAITNLEARVKELEAKLTNVNTALDNIIES